MKEYLNKRYGNKPLRSNPEIPFRVVFFRFYDKKIMSGEITFAELQMDKDTFIRLSTAQEFEMDKEAIIELCINMKLNLEESKLMMESAGFEENLIDA